MATLWFEESDKSVWHRMTTKIGPLDYRAACGWYLTPYPGRIWYQKPGEEGPPEGVRCRTCVGEE